MKSPGTQSLKLRNQCEMVAGMYTVQRTTAAILRERWV